MKTLTHELTRPEHESTELPVVDRLIDAMEYATHLGNDDIIGQSYLDGQDLSSFLEGYQNMGLQSEIVDATFTPSDLDLQKWFIEVRMDGVGGKQSPERRLIDIEENGIVTTYIHRGLVTIDSVFNTEGIITKYKIRENRDTGEIHVTRQSGQAGPESDPNLDPNMSEKEKRRKETQQILMKQIDGVPLMEEDRIPVATVVAEELLLLSQLIEKTNEKKTSIVIQRLLDSVISMAPYLEPHSPHASDKVALEIKSDDEAGLVTTILDIEDSNEQEDPTAPPKCNVFEIEQKDDSEIVIKKNGKTIPPHDLILLTIDLQHEGALVKRAIKAAAEKAKNEPSEKNPVAA